MIYARRENVLRSGLMSESSYSLPPALRWRVQRERRNGRRTGRVVAQLVERRAGKRHGDPVEIPGKLTDPEELPTGGGVFYPATGERAGRMILGGMHGNALQEIAAILNREGPGAFPPASPDQSPAVRGLRFLAREDHSELWVVPITLHGRRIGVLERNMEPGAEWSGADCGESVWALRDIWERSLVDAKREARRVVARAISEKGLAAVLAEAESE